MTCACVHVYKQFCSLHGNTLGWIKQNLSSAWIGKNYLSRLWLNDLHPFRSTAAVVGSEVKEGKKRGGGERERGRGRDKDRKKQREKEPETERDRQRKRQRRRQTEKERGRERQRKRETERGRERDREIERGKEREGQTDRQTNRWTDEQTNRQTERNRQIHIEHKEGQEKKQHDSNETHHFVLYMCIFKKEGPHIYMYAAHLNVDFSGGVGRHL